MAIAEHIWELVLFLLIVAGPVPFCLLLCLANQNQSKRNSFAHSLLIALVGWVIAEVSSGLLLGMLNCLSLNWTLFIQTSFLISGLIVLCHPYGARLPALLGWRKSQFDKTELLILSSIVAVGIVLLFKLIAQPITEFDSLDFHLPAIARWYQSGSLTLLDPTGHWIFAHQDARLYPYNWHILSVLFLMPFREDVCVALPMLIAWTILGLSVYLLSCEFGSARIYSLAAASLVLTMPMILDQVNTILVDLPLAAIFMVSLYFALSYHQTRAPVEFTLFLASIGLLSGIKLFGVAYAGFTTGLLVILEIKLFLMQRNFVKQYRQLFQVKFWICSGVAIALLLSSFWYTKNFWQIKNYVADSSSSLFASTQITIAPPLSGVWKLQNTTLTNQFDITNISNWKILASQLLIRLQLPFLAMLSQILLLPYLLLTQKEDRRRLLSVFLLLISVGFLYWNTPYSSGTNGGISGEISLLFGANIRYGYSCLAVLGIAASVVASSVKNSKKAVLAVVLLSSTLGIVGSTIFSVLRNESFREGKVIWITQLFTNLVLRFNQERTIGLFDSFSRSSLLALFVYPVAYISIVLIALKLLKTSRRSSFTFARRKPIKRFSSTASVFLCVGLFVASTWTLRGIREAYRTEIYQGIYEYLAANLDSDSKVGYLLSSRSYLFYGKDLKNTVLHIPLEQNKEQEWLEALQQNKVKFVAAGPFDRKNLAKEDHFLRIVEQRKLVPSSGHNVDNEPVLYPVQSN